jgi:hypothetical protein
MSNINEIHEQAMDLAEHAFVARLHGDTIRAKELFEQAFRHESEAAQLLAGEVNDEPSRSVLHRSAAALALECGEFSAAERLIQRALAGNPPRAIADELRALLADVNIHRVPPAPRKSEDQH